MYSYLGFKLHNIRENSIIHGLGKILSQHRLFHLQQEADQNFPACISLTLQVTHLIQNETNYAKIIPL
jgi:hypothetical protein